VRKHQATEKSQTTISAAAATGQAAAAFVTMPAARDEAEFKRTTSESTNRCVAIQYTQPRLTSGGSATTRKGARMQAASALMRQALGHAVQAHCLLDVGSAKNYISFELANKVAATTNFQRWRRA
jgi:hypothetical protein